MFSPLFQHFPEDRPAELAPEAMQAPGGSFSCRGCRCDGNWPFCGGFGRVFKAGDGTGRAFCGWWSRGGIAPASAGCEPQKGLSALSGNQSSIPRNLVEAGPEPYENHTKTIRNHTLPIPRSYPESGPFGVAEYRGVATISEGTRIFHRERRPWRSKKITKSYPASELRSSEWRSAPAGSSRIRRDGGDGGRGVERVPLALFSLRPIVPMAPVAPLAANACLTPHRRGVIPGGPAS